MFKHLISKRGYTFTEIMIVIVVLGIFLAIVVPIFSTSPQKKQDCENQRTLINATLLDAMSGMFDNGDPQYGVVDENGIMTANSNGELLIPFKAKSYTEELYITDDGTCYCYDSYTHVYDEYTSYYDFSHRDDENKAPVSQSYVTTREAAGHTFSGLKYNGEAVTSFKLVPVDIGQDEYVFTMGDLRGGHWQDKYSNDALIPQTASYNDYTSECYFLKQQSLRDYPFYLYLYNQGYVPTTATSSDTDSDTTTDSTADSTATIAEYMKDFPICPFSDCEHYTVMYFYYILQDGTVVCSHCDENLTEPEAANQAELMRNYSLQSNALVCEAVTRRFKRGGKAHNRNLWTIAGL